MAPRRWCEYGKHAHSCRGRNKNKYKFPLGDIMAWLERSAEDIPSIYVPREKYFCKKSKCFIQHGPLVFPSEVAVTQCRDYRAKECWYQGIQTYIGFKQPYYFQTLENMCAAGKVY